MTRHFSLAGRLGVPFPRFLFQYPSLLTNFACRTYESVVLLLTDDYPRMSFFCVVLKQGYLAVSAHGAILIFQCNRLLLFNLYNLLVNFVEVR